MPNLVGWADVAALVSAEPEKTSRLQGYDYSQPGLYFLTICTKGRIPWFGTVTESGMEKSLIGDAAQSAWFAVPQHFPDVRIDEFCVMPDHVHGLLEITHPVGTQNFASLRDGYGNRFGPQSRNLASIIRGYKIGVTKAARSVDPSFQWQSRFWDRIVRDTSERDEIRRYILQNPSAWWTKSRNEGLTSDQRLAS